MALSPGKFLSLLCGGHSPYREMNRKVGPPGHHLVLLGEKSHSIQFKIQVGMLSTEPVSILGWKKDSFFLSLSMKLLDF